VRVPMPLGYPRGPTVNRLFSPRHGRELASGGGVFVLKLIIGLLQAPVRRIAELLGLDAGRGAAALINARAHGSPGTARPS